VAALFGFTGISASADIARILFYIFVVISWTCWSWACGFSSVTP
jgi:uncharacterized membrane protein YtjA (UPF0391 family)